MPLEPFELFRPFSDVLEVALLTKETGGTAKETFRLRDEASLHQVHGNRTIRVSGPLDRTEKADGLLTDIPGLILSIRSADCQTFAVFEPKRRVIGVLHAGWKGLLAGAIDAFFEKLSMEWGIDPGETFVAAGPSLCTTCAEFTDPARELPGIDPTFFIGRTVDLRGIADARLRALGVREDRFFRSQDCTRCQPATYWTYRGGDREDVLKGSTNVLAMALKSV